MNIDLDTRALIPLVIGFVLGWFVFAGSEDPVIINIDRSECLQQEISDEFKIIE